MSEFLAEGLIAYDEDSLTPQEVALMECLGSKDYTEDLSEVQPVVSLDGSQDFSPPDTKKKRRVTQQPRKVKRGRYIENFGGFDDLADVCSTVGTDTSDQELFPTTIDQQGQVFVMVPISLPNTNTTKPISLKIIWMLLFQLPCMIQSESNMHFVLHGLDSICHNHSILHTHVPIILFWNVEFHKEITLSWITDLLLVKDNFFIFLYKSVC